MSNSSSGVLDDVTVEVDGCDPVPLQSDAGREMVAGVIRSAMAIVHARRVRKVDCSGCLLASQDSRFWSKGNRSGNSNDHCVSACQSDGGR